MAHMMKHTKAGCGHMFAHYDRSCENISNENIDPERTPLNYNLAEHQQMLQGDFVRKRCSEVRCQNRKDVNVMCSWVVTAPQELPEEHIREFFERSYNFLEQRYGKENVVSAYVHMDEVTPHMHFAFVPVVYDKKKERFKVSAKEAVNRTDLKTFHKDLQEEMNKFREEHENEFECHVLNGATENGNLTIEGLKANSLQERNDIEIEFLEEVMERSSEEINKLQNAQNELMEVRAERNALESEITALKADMNVLQEQKRALQVEIVDLQVTKELSELSLFKRFLNEHPKIKELFENWCNGTKQRVQSRMNEFKALVNREQGFSLNRQENAFKGQNNVFEQSERE